ncbi:MAG: hypothetical protein JXA90_06510 [Planctomycetes bacterium]|nr:hypothetical protein [Planctomycetota bacterium]
MTSSDAHVLEDIGRSRTSFFTRGASLDEITMALRGIDGRNALVH